jgi:glucosamine-6-phosphate deaminase
LQILGIGRTGHIGFNEPGSAPNSGTRLVTLDDLTRSDAARDFGGKANVPTKAITMGIGTIFKAREIILMAWSAKKKASIIKKAVEGEISGEVPATYLQLSDHVEFVLDEAAASELTRFDTPWLVKDCSWEKCIEKESGDLAGRYRWQTGIETHRRGLQQPWYGAAGRRAGPGLQHQH